MRTLLTLLSVSLIACGGADRATPSATAPEPTTGAESSTPEAPSPETPTPETAPSPADPIPEITLLDAGAEPRRVLRYQIPEGATERIQVSQRVETTISLEGHRMGSPTALPIVTRVSFGPASITQSGGVITPFRVDAMELGRGEGMAEAAQRAAAAAVEPLVGTTGSLQTDARGRVIRSNIDVPPGVTPQMASTLENMRKAMVDAGVPFPEQAVGVGARWQVRKRIAQGGLQIETVATYTLQELTADGGRLDRLLSGSAPPQPFPATPDGSTAELESLTLRGGGETRFSFTQLASPSNSWVEIDIQARIRSRGESHGMQTHMRQTVVIEPITEGLAQ
ncbi:MAG: hypothetical protein GXP55_17905 [Deltaproteobacteria bacterium]|nr:hypothetical protein [Deltaproteobacteria bacterium]